MNTWWGYRHVNGTYQVKRYYDRRDLEDARDSDFVDAVSEPFKAEGREDALQKVKSLLSD